MGTRSRHLVVAVVVALALAACSGGSDHDDADVSFAQQMIPHHRQATEMADLVDARTQDADLLGLAERITAAQGPEIDTMTALLRSWGEQVPDEASPMASMPGMLGDDELASLADASGQAFDRRFLTLMIEHHRGAITMADAEVEDGSSEDAVELAEQIRTEQKAEIELMRSLLAS